MRRRERPATGSHSRCSSRSSARFSCRRSRSGSSVEAEIAHSTNEGDAVARVDVVMPQMGESIAEGTLSKWVKRGGDQVKRDEPIFEISTDKVDAEIPSPTNGVIAEIIVTEGQTVPVQALVARIETDVNAAVS